jgi:hypothetical protein
VLADDLTGFTEARDVLRRVGGVLLSEDAANALAAALVLTVTPLIKAEALADAADTTTDMAREVLRHDAHNPSGLTMINIAHGLDAASAQIRKGTR